MQYYLTRKTITNIYANQCYNIIYLYFLATGSFNDNQMTKNTKRPWLKKVLWAISLLILAGAGIIWYLFTLTFDDTKELKPAYTVEADALISEFMKNDSIANQKYSEKIITVNGIVSDIEQPADTSVNIKMTDTVSGSYIIFAFQAKDMAAARKLKAGDKASIKGSCSGGTYSKILESESITFKRCVVNQ